MTKKLFVLALLIASLGTSLFAMRYLIEVGGAYNGVNVSTSGGYSASSEDAAFGFLVGGGVYDLLGIDGDGLTADINVRFIQKNWDITNWRNNYVEVYPKLKYIVGEVQPFLGIGVGYLLNSDKGSFGNKSNGYKYGMNDIDMSIGVGCDYLYGNILLGVAYNLSLTPAYEYEFKSSYVNYSAEYSHWTTTIIFAWLF